MVPHVGSKPNHIRSPDGKSPSYRRTSSQSPSAAWLSCCASMRRRGVSTTVVQVDPIIAGFGADVNTTIILQKHLIPEFYTSIQFICWLSSPAVGPAPKAHAARQPHHSTASSHFDLHPDSQASAGSTGSGSADREQSNSLVGPSFHSAPVGSGPQAHPAPSLFPEATLKEGALRDSYAVMQ